MILEARALVMTIRRLAVTTFGHDLKQVTLVDNMSVCLSFDRSRAQNFLLLNQTRRFSSYLLSRNLRVTVRWIPSELNTADGPSRDRRAVCATDSKQI